tara:strand:+ start:614 stop:799 length:186 start_codon:yes stop_codon:yes gene_type:complete
MNCPSCHTNHIQACTIAYKDELGSVVEPFCYCSRCDTDVTEEIVDKWVEDHTEKVEQDEHN